MVHTVKVVQKPAMDPGRIPAAEMPKRNCTISQDLVFDKDSNRT